MAIIKPGLQQDRRHRRAGLRIAPREHGGKERVDARRERKPRADAEPGDERAQHREREQPDHDGRITAEPDMIEAAAQRIGEPAQPRQRALRQDDEERRRAGDIDEDASRRRRWRARARWCACRPRSRCAACPLFRSLNKRRRSCPTGSRCRNSSARCRRRGGNRSRSFPRAASTAPMPTMMKTTIQPPMMPILGGHLPYLRPATCTAVTSTEMATEIEI